MSKRKAAEAIHTAIIEFSWRLGVWARRAGPRANALTASEPLIASADAWIARHLPLIAIVFVGRFPEDFVAAGLSVKAPTKVRVPPLCCIVTA